jgi:GntR family transcriptional regulator
MTQEHRTGIEAEGAPDQQEGPRFVPLYRQVKALITDRLQRADWKPGEPIPSEAELAARYRVSQGTVRKAIDELAAERVLVRRQGRGTFVASHLAAGEQFRFLRLRMDEPGASLAAIGESDGWPESDAGAAGAHSGSVRGARSIRGERLLSRIIECRRLKGPAEIARLLHLRAGETVVFIRRVLELSGDPTVLDEIWLPGARFKGLSAEGLATYEGPLYALLETEFGVRMIRAEERIKAVAAPLEVARLLGLALREPVLRIDRLTRTYHDVPVEFRRAFCSTTRHHYFNELS